MLGIGFCANLGESASWRFLVDLVPHVCKEYSVVKCSSDSSAQIEGSTLFDKLTIDGCVVTVEIVSSATKHGQCKEDILCALERSVYDETLESEPNKTLSIGYDRNARLLEVIFHVVSEDYIVVFHSMPCRKCYAKRMVM